jgi:hypothetical protein
MITSWKELFDAVERMRHSQKKYFLTKTLENLREAKKYEAVVDACIEQKRAEWERQRQPELAEVTHE